MSKSALRIGVILLTLAASVIHFYICIAVVQTDGFSPLVIAWILNGLGYLGLLAAYLGYIPFFKGKVTGWALAAFAVVTIIAWVIIDDHIAKIGWVTAVIELALALLVYFSMRGAASGGAARA